MEKAPTFNLWLEFEHTQPQPGDNPADDFANEEVWLPDGRRYALNVWTFGFMRRARYPWPYEEGIGEPAEYLLPPDLFVERLDRSMLERVVERLLVAGAMRSDSKGLSRILCSGEAHTRTESARGNVPGSLLESS